MNEVKDVNGKVTKRNKLLIVLISLVSVVCFVSFSIIGILLYKGNDNIENILEPVSEINSSTTLKSVTQDNATDEDNSYYNQALLFFEKTSEFHKVTYDDILMMKVTDSNRNRLNQKTNDYIIFLQSFNPSPVTDVDKILHENVMDAKYDMEQVAYHALHYINTGDITHKKLHREYFVKFKVHANTIKAVEEQYY